MTRFLGRGLISAALIAALCLVGGPGAAETRTVVDGRYDAPAGLDIRKATFSYGDRALVVRVKLAQRPRNGVVVQANIDPARKNVGGEFFLHGARDGRSVNAELSYARRQDAGGVQVGCTGVRGSYRRSSRTVRLAVPVSCLRRHESLGKVAWLGAVTYARGLDSAPGTARNRPAFIKVARG